MHLICHVCFTSVCFTAAFTSGMFALHFHTCGSDVVTKHKEIRMITKARKSSHLTMIC